MPFKPSTASGLGAHLLRYRRHSAHDKLVVDDIWNGALKAAKRVEKKYGKNNLGPYSKFDWGMLNGKLSALRWVLGDEWDSRLRVER